MYGITPISTLPVASWIAWSPAQPESTTLLSIAYFAKSFFSAA